MREFQLTVRLAAPRTTVWQAISTMEGVNYELAPYLRMTFPRAAQGKTLADVPLGRPAFTSIVLLLGLAPIDLHRLTLESVSAEQGFYERSTTLMNALWIHERTLRDVASGACSVTDRIAFSPRVGPLEAVVLPIVKAIFAHRHRRLLRRYGAA